MSKVLKTMAKEDLEAFMKANNILPASQHSFRKGRSCTTALATVQATWVSATAKSKVVAVIGFDLSAAFDKVGRENLLPKMLAMGIEGKAFEEVLLLLHQRKAARRLGRAGVRHRGRGVQHQAGVPVGAGSVPAPRLRPPPHPADQKVRRQQRLRDDTAVWVNAEDIEEAQRELQRLANAMAKFTKDNGLALNRAKNQVMIGSARAKDILNVVILLEGAEVRPDNTFELLGVTFDQRFTVRLYLTNLSKEAKFCAGRVAGLAQHLTCGQLL
jgi:hypothetical protein